MWLAAPALNRFDGKVYVLFPTSPVKSLWELRKTLGNGPERKACGTFAPCCSALTPPLDPPLTNLPPQSVQQTECMKRPASGESQEWWKVSVRKSGSPSWVSGNPLNEILGVLGLVIFKLMSSK